MVCSGLKCNSTVDQYKKYDFQMRCSSTGKAKGKPLWVFQWWKSLLVNPFRHSNTKLHYIQTIEVYTLYRKQLIKQEAVVLASHIGFVPLKSGNICMGYTHIGNVLLIFKFNCTTDEWNVSSQKYCIFVTGWKNEKYAKTVAIVAKIKFTLSSTIPYPINPWKYKNSFYHLF